jgi:hypothetical protein
MIPSCERFIFSDHIIIRKKGTRQVPNTSPFAADGMTKTVKSAVKRQFCATAACLLSISPGRATIKNIGVRQDANGGDGTSEPKICRTADQTQTLLKTRWQIGHFSLQPAPTHTAIFQAFQSFTRMDY